MTGSIGLGLVLNVLFWTAAVLVAVGLASLAVIEWFPGRTRGVRGEPRGSRGGTQAAESRKGERDGGKGAERYRKAS